MATASARFAELADHYYRVWFRFHPEVAVDAGVAGYESLLTPFAPDELGGLVYLNDQLLVSLDEIEPAELDADERIDYALMRGAAVLENQFLLDVAPRQPDPGRALPINAIYQLTFRPVRDVKAALWARLAAIPRHLELAGEYLDAQAEAIPPLWLQSAVIGARQGGAFLRNLPLQLPAPSRPAGLERLVAEADEALAVFAQLAERHLAPRAAGDFACGRARFEHLLRLRHFLDVSLEQLQAFGDGLLEELRGQLRQAAHALTGGHDAAAALAQIRRAHPPMEQLLGAYRQQMQAARDFVHRQALVTPPARERLEVVDTPVFLRHQIPFAAYVEPTPRDPEQRGYYYVTPPNDAEQLAEHDSVGVKHTCVHEAWPGHHLQFALANASPAARSLPRLLNASATFYEGWALYCEQLMYEEGFLSGPEHRFILLRDRLWRALRIVIDIGLHTQQLSVAQAAELMVTHLGFPKSQAIADITWYSRSPTVPMSYATGWAIINALRDCVRGEHDGFDLCTFHDGLLSAGSIGLPKVIERVYGMDRWEKVRHTLFEAPESGVR